MSISPGRVVLVVLGLAGIGFVCGAVLGGLVSLMETGFSTEYLSAVLGFGAMFGAPIGAIVTPIVGFVFARKVPLWKAIIVGGTGALLGGAAIAPFGVWGILGALPGFLLAMTGLYIHTARRTRELERAA